MEAESGRRFCFPNAAQRRKTRKTEPLMLGNAISVEFGNAISVEGAPWKVRPGRCAAGRCAAGSSRPRRFAAEIAPGPGIATGNAAAIRETRPEAPDLEESGASGAGRLSVAATMRSWRRFRRRCGRTCRCRPSRWSRGGSCPSCGLRPRPQRRARGSARPPRRALRRRR